MSKSLGLLVALIGVGSWVSSAYAGPNAGGTLIVSFGGIVQCVDVPDYCGNVSTPDCESAVTSTPITVEPVVLNILAALPPGGRLKAIAFGWSYDPNVYVAGWAPCGDVVIELPQVDWPESGSGTAITWSTVKTDELVEVYWVGAYAYLEPGRLVLQGHPTQGGVFADDAIPATEDPIAGFGTFGFGMPGSVVCPVDDGAEGACCGSEGDCRVTTEEDCVAAGGVYQGDGVPCEPNPCVDPITGACCLEDGTCVELGEAECIEEGGIFQGGDIPCVPDPCVPPTPTVDTSWGEIKIQYR